jgi:hypothetical protein
MAIPRELALPVRRPSRNGVVPWGEGAGEDAWMDTESHYRAAFAARLDPDQDRAAVPT